MKINIKKKILCLIIISLFIIINLLYGDNTDFKIKEVKKIAGGFQFTEGPCWVSKGYLVFSDIQGNTIYKWSEKNEIEIFLKPSGNSNGLALDKEGKLIIAQQGNRQIVRLEEDNKETVLASQ